MNNSGTKNDQQHARSSAVNASSIPGAGQASGSSTERLVSRPVGAEQDRRGQDARPEQDESQETQSRQAGGPASEQSGKEAAADEGRESEVMPSNGKPGKSGEASSAKPEA